VVARPEASDGSAQVEGTSPPGLAAGRPPFGGLSGSRHADSSDIPADARSNPDSAFSDGHGHSQQNRRAADTYGHPRQSGPQPADGPASTRPKNLEFSAFADLHHGVSPVRPAPSGLVLSLLAVYYGDYVAKFRATLEAHPNQPGYGFAVGPIRSGRVGWETIKTFYPDSQLITRYASPEVAAQLTNLVTIYARDPQDVNSAGLTLSELEALSSAPTSPDSMVALPFTSAVPTGGHDGSDVRLFYNLYDQIQWTYDAASGRYLRSQDPGDGSGDLTPLVDKLTGQTLSADNIVVLFANHSYENLAGTILKIRLLYLDNQPGLLFRDGRWYAIKWSSLKQNLMIRGEDGGAIALKPGQTFFEVVSRQSTWDQEARLVRFHNPPLPTKTPVTPITSTPTTTETPTPTATHTPTVAPSLTPSPPDTLEP
jgi:hypothetical protein